MKGDAIDDVTDTALWVAAHRANESRRSDSAFDDALAAQLAGLRGRRIARSFPHNAIIEWSVVIRTAAIDRLIMGALQAGIDTVVNLGAGLDTRPYRLTVPPETRWIEIDLPGLVQPKNAALRGQTAHCHVERIALDLKDRNCRHAVFAEIGATAGDVLLISEGVLPYFSNEDAADLAADLRSVTVFRRWILDFDNAGVRPMPRRWARRLQSAPFLFQVPDWFRFFEQCGWTASSVITSAQESARLGRPYPFGFPLGLLMRLLPKDMSRRILEMSGAALLRVS